MTTAIFLAFAAAGLLFAALACLGAEPARVEYVWDSSGEC